MASRRQAHCRRRAIHAAMRKGIVPQQEGGSSGSSDSGKAQKAIQAQKARKA